MPDLGPFPADVTVDGRPVVLLLCTLFDELGALAPP